MAEVMFLAASLIRKTEHSPHSLANAQNDCTVLADILHAPWGENGRKKMQVETDLCYSSLTKKASMSGLVVSWLE